MAQLITTFAFILVLSIICAALYLEPYKFWVMYMRSLDHLSYIIFPWSDPGQKSASDPVWLIIHLVSALSHLFLSGIMFLNYNKNLATLWNWSNTFFAAIIITNLTHFGEASIDVAMLANGIPLLIALFSFDKEQKVWWKGLVYFLAISSPVVLEIVLYLRK